MDIDIDIDMDKMIDSKSHTEKKKCLYLFTRTIRYSTPPDSDSFLVEKPFSIQALKNVTQYRFLLIILDKRFPNRVVKSRFDWIFRGTFSCF